MPLSLKERARAALARLDSKRRPLVAEKLISIARDVLRQPVEPARDRLDSLLRTVPPLFTPEDARLLDQACDELLAIPSKNTRCSRVIEGVAEKYRPAAAAISPRRSAPAVGTGATITRDLAATESTPAPAPVRPFEHARKAARSWSVSS